MDTAEAVTFLQSIPVWGYSGSIIDCGLMYRVAGEVYVINVAPKEIVLRSELTKVPQEILGRIRSRIATNFNISPEMIIEKTAAVKLGS